MNLMYPGAPQLATEAEIEETLVAYFSSDHWRDFLAVLARGKTVRHAHAYFNSTFDPRSIAMLLTFYFAKFGKPLERKIKILPITDDFLNVYNVQPEGMAHWEFFLNYSTEALLRPTDSYGARGAHSIEYWDDTFMEEYYKQFSFKDIGISERKDADNYFRSKAWNDNLLVLIDDFGGVIHSHALVESSLHPEQLIEIGAEHIRRKGWELIRSTSIVFNSYGMDIGKLVYLLKKPEIVIELEWHFSPEVTIQPASIPYFRLATSSRLNELLQIRPYVSFGREMVSRVLARLSYPLSTN